MQEEQIREALNAHWRVGSWRCKRGHDIYDDDAICDYPSQASESSGERICRPCGVIIRASRRVSTSSEFSEKVISGSRNTPITCQGRPAYTVSIMEFRNGKVVHETQYFADPFEAPAWRSQWVQRIA